LAKDHLGQVLSQPYW